MKPTVKRNNPPLVNERSHQLINYLELGTTSTISGHHYPSGWDKVCKQLITTDSKFKSRLTSFNLVIYQCDSIGSISHLKNLLNPLPHMLYSEYCTPYAIFRTLHHFYK